MSKPRKKWWGYIKNVIKDYPRLERWHNDLAHDVPMTAPYNCIGGGRSSDVSDPTYKFALRQLPRQEQKEYEAVTAAIWTTERYPNGVQRMKIIKMVYWKRSHTVDGAGEAVGYKEAQTRRINGEFIRLVGEYLDFT